MPYLAEQVSLFDPDSWSGKTSPEPSPPTAAKTLQRSLKKSSKSASRMPMCKCVSRGGGQSPGAIMLTMDDGALLGAYTMRSFGECPNEENVSLLSQILEVSPHPKYSLSARACLGILNRAERRGKILPQELKKALENQSVSKNEPVNRGGKGILDRKVENGGNGVGVQKEVCYTLNTVDRHAVAVDCRNFTEQEVNGTLQAKSNGGSSVNLNNVVRTSDRTE